MSFRGWVLIKNEKVLKRQELIIIALWIDVLRVQSRKNNSENLTIFRGKFKSENFKKISKKLSFLSFFFLRFYLKNIPHPALGPKKAFDAS